MTELNLEDCYAMTSLPDGITALVHLERLNLQGLNISTLPDSIGHVHEVHALPKKVGGSLLLALILRLSPILIGA